MRNRPVLTALVALSMTPWLSAPAWAATAAGPAAWEASRLAVAAGGDPIPGPRDCFWSRGPVSGDPYINIAYPDAGTFYWSATFSTPPGAHLSLQGDFPHARYMSLISYDGAGVPIDDVADYLIRPEAGGVNPFIAGADRTSPRRSYRLPVVDAKPDPNQKTGMNLVGQTRDHLAAPSYGLGQQTVIYRVYARDRGMDETGGAGLPTPVLTLADGKVLQGAEVCGAMKTRQPPQIDAAAISVPMDKYHELLAAAAAIGPAFPATNPPTWYMQQDRQALYDIYRGKPARADAPRSTGGFYPNLDNDYIRTILNRRLGKVFVVRGKAPTTPRTVNGDARMADGQLRYWSFCSNQGFANTRVNACAYDETIPVGPAGFYTIVVSRAADRPRNAILECGVTWLPMADDGDGAVDDDVTILQLRHMLGAGGFPHSIQAAPTPGDVPTVMGDYYPRGAYTTTSAFETMVPCHLDHRARAN